MAELRVVRSELILGGPKSGKTARADALAAAWLDASPGHRGVYIATAQAWDGEMRERASRVARMETVEEPTELAHAIGRYSRADTLIVVDCLTLWLTARMMWGVEALGATIAHALQHCAGPIILISNEPSSGIVPEGPDARTFLDSLGSLNQQAAAACERVTLMTAGEPLLLKGQP